MKLLITTVTFMAVATALIAGAAASPPKAGSPPKEPKVGRMLKTCAKCHIATWAEWEASPHRQSWSNPLFQAQIAEREDKGEACARCHAPGSLLETGVGKPPQARTIDREFGVNCLTCHVSGKTYHGPIASEGHRGVKVMTEYRDASWCASCHGQPDLSSHDHWTSYQKSPAAKKGTTCQECHMPSVERQLAHAKKPLKNLQPAQSCRKHKFGTEDLSPVTLEAKPVDGQIVVTVTPHEGHTLLVEKDRRLELEIRATKGDGTVLHSEKKTYRHDTDSDLLRCKPETIAIPIKGSGEVKATLTLVLEKGPGRPEEKRIPWAKVGND